jgi:hypothetical protein
VTCHSARDAESIRDTRYEIRFFLVEIFNMTKDELNNMLDAVAGVCLRCFALAVCLMLFSFVFYLVAADCAYSIHSRWFEITRPNFELMYYCWMAFMKIVSFLFFLIPYIAIKLMLRKKQFTP